MIVVIADDFTGAAELAGISLRYGLKVEVCLIDVVETDADVLVVCTDSRSLNVEEAKKITVAVLETILKLKPEFIYKKIDSVLRGHVIDEVKLQMDLTRMSTALILPANPSLGRVIENGEYFINGKKITETGFVSDPEFPIGSSFVKDIIGDNTVGVLKHTDDLPQAGVMIGEAVSVEDMKEWASLINETWMLVGAGDFYTAILDEKYDLKTRHSFELLSPHLYVCGTAFNERKQFIQKLNEELGIVAYLPGAVDEKWLQQTSNIIKTQQKAVIAIDDSPAPALSARIIMAKAVKEIAARENIKEIFIEGGSTAAAVLEELNIKKLTPVNELSRGVVRMKAGDLFITVKPGSYQLPEEILGLYL